MIPTNNQKKTQRVRMIKTARCAKITCRRKLQPGDAAIVKYGIITKNYYHTECWGK